MIVEINHIETSALGAALAALDAIDLKELATVFARWAFELEWDEVPDVDDKMELVIKILDTACESYLIKFGDRELRKTKEEPSVVSDDEPADDLQTPEELKECLDKRAMIKPRQFRKPKRATASGKTVDCVVDKLETEQLGDLVSLIREHDMPALAQRIHARETAFTITKPSGEQIAMLRQSLDALCTVYKIRIGAVRLICN